MSAPAYQSTSEFYRDPASPYAGFPQEHRSGGSMPVQLWRAEQSAFEATNPGLAEVTLTLGIKCDMPFRWDVGDGMTDEKHARNGDLNLRPAFTAGTYALPKDHEILNVVFPSEHLEQLMDAHRLGSLNAFDALTGVTLFRDETIRRTMMQIWAESARAGGSSDLLIDGLLQILIARLLDKAEALTRPASITKLSSRELTRLDSLIDENLAERITVETLANALDLPRWTFADSFKATTGETPHTYVTGRRIAKACDLLRVGALPLAEIAYAVGFASQSHMTDTFRRHLGATPGAWRKEVRG